MNAAQPLPPVHWRRRVKNVLRGVKRRVRRVQPVPRWKDGGPLVVQLDAERLSITVDCVSTLYNLLQSGRLPAAATGLDLTVRGWKPPWPGWRGRLAALPEVTRLELDLPQGPQGGAVVRLTLSRPVACTSLISVVLPLLMPRRSLPEPVSPAVAMLTSPPPWLVADLLHQTDGRSGGSVASEDLRLDAGSLTVVPVDAATANPIGRGIHDPDRPSGTLEFHAVGDRHRWAITRNSAVIVSGIVGDAFEGAHRRALARLTAVTLPATATPSENTPSDRATAETLAALAMTGLIVSAPSLAAGVRDGLATGLAEFLDSPLPRAGADPIDWEIRGIGQRREALRQHASTFVLGRAGTYPTVARAPSVSALLVSRRPHRVVQALEALSAQTYPELEIVVVLHGVEPTTEQRDRMLAHGVRLETVPAALAFGEVLGVATRLASGSLVTKVDDDDHYGPEHIWDLVLALHYSGADLVGKGAEFVHLEQHDVTVRRRGGSEFYTDLVAGGTMLLARGTLEEVGGWRPVARSVDRALLDRVLRAGGLIYRAHGFGFIYTRHDEGHTWGANVSYFVADPSRQWPGKPPYAEFGVR